MKPVKRYYLIFPLLILSFQKIVAQEPDLVLTGGKIFTADTRRLYVEAVAIRNGRIIATGSSGDVEKLKGNSTRIIHLEGRLVVPGFNDAHNHLLLNDLRAYEIRFDSMNPAWNIVKDSLRSVAAKTPPGQWIAAEIGPSVVNSSDAVRFTIDSITTKHPVRLLSWWGHVGIFNTKGLEVMNIAKDAPDPKGGRYERMNDNITLTGKAFEKNAYNPHRSYAKVSAMRDDSLLVHKFRALTEEMLLLGITSYQNMCTLASPDDLTALWARAGLPFRLRLIRWGDMDADGDLVIPSMNPGKKVNNLSNLTVSGTKWLIDGTPIEQGAYQYSPYPGKPTWYGRMNYSKADIERACREAVARGDQLLFHVSGEQSYGELLDVLERIDADWPALRPRIEHGDMADYSEEFLERTKRLGIIIVQNPTHFAPVEGFEGSAEPKSYGMAMKTLLREGIPLAIGSDGPFNPFLNLLMAVSHPGRPEEAITMEEAVIAYTRTAAYAEFEEREKGTIEPGKLADLVVLSQDIFKIPLQAIMGTRSLMTIIGGKIVYERGH